ncbi:uncharacterized protein LOC129796645 [Lutzomyia longipalpis]|uniref:uncharacterized protein LOC129796645 n=1 Tax=Lutzomyia longipalpis TaxID=7200 RepID=UPI002483823F|nr:uncharacterized protein LOC129796645 [Lutzomyia longipalpis]
MGTFQCLLWTLFCLGLSGSFGVSADNGYVNLLKPRGDVNGTVFHMEMSMTGGVYNSGYENNAKAIFRFHIVPYGSDKVYILANIVNSYLQNGKKSDPAIDFPINENVGFILTSSGKIVVNKNEPKRNTNWVKIISNFLIFDYEKFNEIKSIDRSIYTVEQPTIYGKCKIRSMGALTESKDIIIKQFFDPKYCDAFKPRVFSDVETLRSVGDLTINNYREYSLVKRKGSYVLDSLQTDQKILWKPSNGKSLTHFFRTTYKFTFVEEAPLSLDDTDFDFSSERNLTLSTLTSANDYFEQEKNFHRLEFMHEQKKELLVEQIKKGLKDIVNIWNKHPISSIGFNQPAAKELTRTSALMEYLTYEQFLAIWESLKEEGADDLLNAFYKVSPIPGTEASVLFTKKLITEKFIDKELGEKMLSKLASSIRKPTLGTLTALKELEGTKTNVALMTYSSVLGTAYKEFSHSEKVKELFEEAKKEYYDKIEFYIQNGAIKNADELRIYIFALGNLRTISLNEPKAESLMKEISEIDDELYLRLLMAFEKTTPTQYLFEVVVKILREAARSPELKAYAIKIAITRLPTPEHFEIVARIMDAQTNNELYNLYEACVRGLVKTGDLPESVLLWLGHREPMSRSTGILYYNPNDVFMGTSVMGYILYNDVTWVPKSIFFNVYQNFDGKAHKVYAVYVRLFNVDKLTSFFLQSDKESSEEEFTYELTIYKGSKVIFFERKKINFASLMNDVIQFMRDFSLLPFKMDIGDIYQHLNFDYFIPTDTGKNLHLYFNVPWMFSAKVNSLKISEESVNINALASLNFTAQSTTGMHMYHPHIKALQGSRELSSVHMTQQISFKLYHDQRHGVDFAIALTENLTPLYGVRFQKNTVVFLNPIGEWTKPFTTNENFKDQVLIDMGRNEKDLLLWHTDIGAKHHIQLVDYTAPPGNLEFPQSVSELLNKKPYSEFNHLSTVEFWMSHLSYVTWNFLAHSAYSYNLKHTLEPCHLFPVKKYVVHIGNDYLLLKFQDKDDKLIVSYKFNTVNGFAQFFRQGPGLESSAFCFDKTIDEIDKSEFQFYYGTYSGNIMECPKDQFQMIFRKTSEFSPNQIEYRNDKYRTYSECIHNSPFLQFREPTNSYRCAEAATKLGATTIDISYKNPPKNFEKHWEWWLNWMFRMYNAVATENIPGKLPGELTLRAVHAMSSPYFDVDVFHHDEKYSLKVDADGVISPNFAISRQALLMEYFRQSPLCTVVTSERKLQSSRHFLHTTNPDTWEEYAKIKNVVVSGKKVSQDKLALMIQHDNQTITVYPTTVATSLDKYEIRIGENNLDVLPMVWNKNQIRFIRVLDTLFFTTDPKEDAYSFTVGYNGESITIVGTNLGNYNSGNCFKL